MKDLTIDDIATPTQVFVNIYRSESGRLFAGGLYGSREDGEKYADDPFLVECAEVTLGKRLGAETRAK